MPKATKGSHVKVHYTGTLDDGTVFDSSEEREPLEFVLGDGSLIPGFEEAVVGMSPGETKRTRIPAGEAYGPRRSDLTVDVERKYLPPGMEPHVGEHLQIRELDGSTTVVKVVAVTPEKVTIDASHPLAGMDLTFDIRLLEVA